MVRRLRFPDLVEFVEVHLPTGVAASNPGFVRIEPREVLAQCAAAGFGDRVRQDRDSAFHLSLLVVGFLGRFPIGKESPALREMEKRAAELEWTQRFTERPCAKNIRQVVMGAVPRGEFIVQG